ncbi:MAG: glycosyltransferase family 2 protein [Pseudobdellovibrionaceae bacterium]
MTSSGPQTFTPPKPKALASILVVAHNAEATLSPCLKSLLKQSLKQIEILVIDNGSTDETPDILASAVAVDSRIRIITRKEAEPLSDVVNLALREAIGRYVSLQHIGGISAPERLAYQIQHLQNHAGAVLCAASAREEFPDGTQKDWLIAPEDATGGVLNRALSHSVPFLGSSAVFDRSVLLNSGPLEGNEHAELLYHAAFKVVHKGKFIGEPKLLYVERKVKPTLSAKWEGAKANLHLRNRYFPAQKLENLKSFVKDMLTKSA